MDKIKITDCLDQHEIDALLYALKSPENQAQLARERMREANKSPLDKIKENARWGT